MHIQTFTDVSGFDALASEWDDLIARSVSSPLFLTYRWQRTWWEHLGHGDLLLIAVRDDADRLIGIAPFFRHTNDQGQRELSFVGCADVSDYLDLIIDRDYADEVCSTIWNFLIGPDALEWDEVSLCNIPHASPTHVRLADLAQSQGYTVTVDVEDVCPVITLPAAWDDYLASLNKKQRHEIRRKLRRAQEAADVRWYVVEGGEGLAADTESFIELHQKSTAEKEDFWDQATKSFFRAIVGQLARTGWLKLYFIEFDGTRAASLLCFDYQNEILVYNSGYDPTQFARLSPGIVLVAYAIQHAIELGRARFDFLRGDEVYKFRFGAVPETVHRLRVVR